MRPQYCPQAYKIWQVGYFSPSENLVILLYISIFLFILIPRSPYNGKSMSSVRLR